MTQSPETAPTADTTGPLTPNTGKIEHDENGFPIPHEPESTEQEGQERSQTEQTPTAQSEQLVEPIDLEKLYKSETVENPEAVFDTDGQIKMAEESLESVSVSIADIRVQIEQKKAELQRIRENLGAGEVPADAGEKLPEEQHLEDLLAQQENFIAMKEEAEELQELQEVMDDFDKLAPDVRIFIIQNGTMPNGDPVKTKNGKEVGKEVAMGLAKSVEEGVKKLTKAVVKLVLAVVKGILKGVFAGIKAAVAK